MILKPKYNMPTTSVSFSNADLNTLLEAYRSWSGNADATAAQLYSFITTPGGARKDFLSTVSLTGTVNANYILQEIK